jgi:hypothetical protein
MEVLAVAIVQLVTDGILVAALAILQSYRPVGIEVEASEVGATTVVHLRVNDIEDYQECAGGNWGMMRDRQW